MKRIIKWYLLPITAVLLSILLRFISATQFFDNLLMSTFKEDKIPSIMAIIDVINHLVVVAPLGIQSIIRARNADKHKDVVFNYGQEQRDLLFHMLSECNYITGTCEEINIRIFRKHFNRLVLDENMKLCSREIKGKLSFSINRDEGLCTQAFKEGHSMLEIEDGSREQYNLTERQKALAGQLKFIVAVPIHPESEGKIKTVICFDSFSIITHAGCEEGILKICETIAYRISSVVD